MTARQLEQFQALYNEYIDAVYNYIFHRVGRNTSLAEDLSSEVFLKAAENFDSFNVKKGTFKSWIFRIAHNHLVNHYRDSKQELSFDETYNIYDENENIHQRLMRGDNKALVLKALEKLPTEARTILHLRYFEELSYEEMSTVIKKTPGTLRTTVHRLLKFLYQEISQLS